MTLKTLYGFNRNPTLAQLVERRTVVGYEILVVILRLLVGIRQVGYFDLILQFLVLLFQIHNSVNWIYFAVSS